MKICFLCACRWCLLSGSDWFRDFSFSFSFFFLKPTLLVYQKTAQKKKTSDPNYRFSRFLQFQIYQKQNNNFLLFPISSLLQLVSSPTPSRTLLLYLCDGARKKIGKQKSFLLAFVSTDWGIPTILAEIGEHDPHKRFPWVVDEQAKRQKNEKERKKFSITLRRKINNEKAGKVIRSHFLLLRHQMRHQISSLIA